MGAGPERCKGRYSKDLRSSGQSWRRKAKRKESRCERHRRAAERQDKGACRQRAIGTFDPGDTDGPARARGEGDMRKAGDTDRTADRRMRDFLNGRAVPGGAGRRRTEERKAGRWERRSARMRVLSRSHVLPFLPSSAGPASRRLSSPALAPAPISRPSAPPRPARARRPRGRLPLRLRRTAASRCACRGA